jgi:hypothetical protein
MTGFPNQFKQPRTTSKGESDQQSAALLMMGVKLLGMNLTKREQNALATVLGAMKREVPKVKHSDLISTLRLLEAALRRNA